MNKTIWIVGGCLLAIAAVSAVLLVSHQEQASAPAPSGAGNGAVRASGETMIVTYTDTGFSPSPVTISAGTTVTWQNLSSHALWIEQTGTEEDVSCNDEARTDVLNECAEIKNGGTYSFTFAEARTFTYTNRSHPADSGSITVSTRTPAGTINPDALPQ